MPLGRFRTLFQLGLGILPAAFDAEPRLDVLQTVQVVDLKELTLGSRALRQTKSVAARYIQTASLVTLETSAALRDSLDVPKGPGLLLARLVRNQSVARRS